MEGITPVNLLEEEREVVVCALLPTREGVRGDLEEGECNRFVV